MKKKSFEPKSFDEIEKLVENHKLKWYKLLQSFLKEIKSIKSKGEMPLGQITYTLDTFIERWAIAKMIKELHILLIREQNPKKAFEESYLLLYRRYEEWEKLTPAAMESLTQCITLLHQYNKTINLLRYLNDDIDAKIHSKDQKSPAHTSDPTGSGFDPDCE